MASAEREARLAAAARRDVAAAAGFCLRSERTGKPLVLDPGHLDLLAAAAKHKRLVVVASPKLGKTTLITHMLLLQRLGLDPQRYRAKVWSATKANATRHTHAALPYRGEPEPAARFSGTATGREVDRG